MKLTRCFGTISLLLLAACGPSEQWTEAKRIECLDKLCEGDVPPKRDPMTEEVLKLNGQWFIGPNAYFSSGMNGAAFFWSSKTPARPNTSNFPEKALATSGHADEVTIEILFRSNNIPPEPRGYKLIELAEANGWIESRRTVRNGLDAITMKHVIGPRGQFIDNVTYYVAIGLTGGDGKPPVATCSHDDPRNGGGTGFMWQPGIWAGIRMNQRHCADWPEIYLETVRVLQLLQRAQP